MYILESFDKELYERDLKQDAYEEGLQDKLISLTKSLAIKLNVNRLYIMFVDEEESLVVIVDSNNDAYVEIKVE